jgi:hypothetical protein
MYINIHFRTPSGSGSVIISCEADFALKSRQQLSQNTNTNTHTYGPRAYTVHYVISTLY